MENKERGDNEEGVEYKSDVELIREAFGEGTVLVLVLNEECGYELMTVTGQPSERQMCFVEDLLVLERRSFVLRFVMWVERMMLRFESWWRGGVK